VIDDDPEGGRAFLESIESVGRSAFAELDLALALDAGVEPATDPGLARLPELVQVLRGAGMDITVDVRGEPVVLAPMVDRSAFRILQEALTNVAKHSSSPRADVTVAFASGVVSVAVVSAGLPVDGAPSSGRGLAGMEERARAVGGRLHVEPRTEGFVVQADLPVEVPAIGPQD
jgi:signal transduction histidine kinase